MTLNNFKNQIYFFKSNKFSKDVFYNIISTVIISFSALLINIIIGNHYKIENLGIFNFVYSIYMILGIIAVFGVTDSIIRYTAEYKDKIGFLNELVSAGFILVSITSLFVAISLLLFLHYLPQIFPNADVIKALTPIVLSLPFLSVNKIFFSLLNGTRRMIVYALSLSLRSILIVLFIYFSIIFHKSIYFVIFAFLIAEIIIFIWLILYTINFIKIKFTINNIKYWVKTHFLFGSKSLLTNSVGEVNTNVDILMIGYMLGNYYVGVFSFASTIAKGILLIPGIIQLNFNPIISHLWVNNEIETLKSHIKKILKINFGLMLFIVILACIAYPLLIYFFMNDAVYWQSLSIFYILIVGVFVLSVFYFVGAIQSMAGFPEVQLMIVSIVCVFNVIVSCVFIYLLGVNGAALSTSMSFVLVIILLLKNSKKKLGIEIFEFNNKILTKVKFLWYFCKK